MENKKNNKGAMALLIVIIVILAVLCILFATGTISFKSNVNNTQTTSSNENQVDTTTQSPENDYVGEYTYSNDDGEVPFTASIDLTEDGTFYASQAATMKSWFYGTYEINGNVLKLNYKFSTQAVQKMGEKLSKTITYTIENETISGTKNEDNLFASNENASLKKSTTNYNVKNDFLDSLIDMYTME